MVCTFLLHDMVVDTLGECDRVRSSVQYHKIVAMSETIDFIYYIFEFHCTNIISKLMIYILSINFISDTTYLLVLSLLQVIQAFR